MDVTSDFDKSNFSGVLVAKPKWNEFSKEWDEIETNSFKEFEWKGGREIEQQLKGSEEELRKGLLLTLSLKLEK